MSMSLCSSVKGRKRPRTSSTFFLYSVSCGICSPPGTPRHTQHHHAGTKLAQGLEADCLLALQKCTVKYVSHFFLDLHKPSLCSCTQPA